MGAFLSLRVEFSIYNNDPNIIEKLHNLYRDYGMSVDHIYSKNEVSYEEACSANQKCFDEMISFDKHQHYRMTWVCDWISFVDTFPCIDVIMPNYENDDVPYKVQKEECILFPENEITPDVFQKILNLVTDLYNMDYVHSVMIEKEE